MFEEKDGGVLVLVHDDGDVGCLLTELFRSNGFQVEWCRSLEAAQQRLVAARAEIVVTPWDRPIGKQVYRWATTKAHALRRRFVFVVDQMPRCLQRAAASRRVARVTHVEAVLEAVRTTHRRLASERVKRAAPAGQAPTARLLLVEDDAEQRAAMSDVLRAIGYDVIAASGVHAALTLLAASHVDAVLSDWCMGDGTGAELYQWIREHDPALVGAMIFITGGDPDAAHAVDGPVLVLPKGQDSRELKTALTRAIEIGRGARAPRSTRTAPAREHARQHH